MNYDFLASEDEPYARAGWSSSAALEYRYIFLKSSVAAYLQQASPARNMRYLDIGCNDGYLTRKIAQSFANKIFETVGIEKSVSAFQNATKSKSFVDYPSNICFKNIDFMDFTCSSKSWNMISLIGLMQIKSFPAEQALKKIGNLLSSNGQLYLTTLNLDWEGFVLDSENKPSSEQRWWSTQGLESACQQADLRIVSHKSLSIRQNMCFLDPMGGYVHLCIIEHVS